MSEEPQNPQTNQPQMPAPNNPVTPESSPPNRPSQQPNQQPNQQQPSQQQPATSSDLEAENRALRAILSGHVDGINIDEELEFVGPTGKYRPANRPPEQVPEQRTSRRQGLTNARAEESGGIDIAAIDAELDNYLKTAYGFDFSEGQDA